MLLVEDGDIAGRPRGASVAAPQAHHGIKLVRSEQFFDHLAEGFFDVWTVLSAPATIGVPLSPMRPNGHRFETPLPHLLLPGWGLVGRVAIRVMVPSNEAVHDRILVRQSDGGPQFL